MSDVRDAIERGGLIECAAEDYPRVRRELQDAAAWYIDNGQHVKAQMALMEVKRLDKIHSSGMEEA